MFGTRLNGPTVHASARYIHTKLSPSLGAKQIIENGSPGNRGHPWSAWKMDRYNGSLHFSDMLNLSPSQ